MTRPVVPVLVVCLLAATGLWSKPASSASASKKPTVRPTLQAKAKASAKKTSALQKSSSRKSPSKYVALRSRSKSSRVNPANRYSPPAAPASNRILEIQQALHDRGYLNTVPDGIWSASSVEALKRFESENKLKIDGKIDSRILIGLGLGPKYDVNLSLPVPGSSGVVVADDSKNDFQRLN